MENTSTHAYVQVFSRKLQSKYRKKIRKCKKKILVFLLQKERNVFIIKLIEFNNDNFISFHLYFIVITREESLHD